VVYTSPVQNVAKISSNFRQTKFKSILKLTLRFERFDHKVKCQTTLKEKQRKIQVKQNIKTQCFFLLLIFSQDAEHCSDSTLPTVRHTAELSHALRNISSSTIMTCWQFKFWLFFNFLAETHFLQFHPPVSSKLSSGPHFWEMFTKRPFSTIVINKQHYLKVEQLNSYSRIVQSGGF